MRPLDRAGLLALTPDVYLADGYLDADGSPRPEFQSTYAAAAVAQLHEAEAAPQEVGFTIAGIEELLGVRDELDPGDRLWASIEEATGIVATMIGQTCNEGLRQWLFACAQAVGDDEELDAFIAHIEAVNRIYAMSEMIAKPEPPASP